jgi:hypothetical protein
MRFNVLQIALLMMLIMQGCSTNRLPEKSITDFWTWFSADHEAEHTSAQISKNIQTINKELNWQYGATEGTKRVLIISTGGNKKLFPLVKEIVKDAPKMEHWKAVAFKPKVEKLQPIEVDGMMVSPEDIFFTVQPHDGVVDVCILLDHTIPPATAEKIAVAMLDQALGEYEAATKIGKVTFAPITELNEDNSNFRELRKAVDDYCK